jgi:hypothetical protein
MVFSDFGLIAQSRRIELRFTYAAYSSTGRACNLCDAMEEIWRKSGGRRLPLNKPVVFS